MIFDIFLQDEINAAIGELQDEIAAAPDYDQEEW